MPSRVRDGLGDALSPAAAHAYLSPMTMLSLRITGVLVAMASLLATPAAAQIIPTPPALENRIPAPLPPPPQPPIINGPLQQGPPPGVYLPPRVNSHSDRTVGCLHQGSSAGLTGRALQSYARECANAH